MHSNFCLDSRYIKTGVITVKWSILCGSKVNDGLQVTTTKLESKTYLLCLVWEFAYDKMTWIKLKCI